MFPVQLYLLRQLPAVCLVFWIVSVDNQYFLSCVSIKLNLLYIARDILVKPVHICYQGCPTWALGAGGAAACKRKFLNNFSS